MLGGDARRQEFFYLRCVQVFGVSCVLDVSVQLSRQTDGDERRNFFDQRVCKSHFAEGCNEWFLRTGVVATSIIFDDGIVNNALSLYTNFQPVK